MKPRSTNRGVKTGQQDQLNAAEANESEDTSNKMHTETIIKHASPLDCSYP